MVTLTDVVAVLGLVTGVAGLMLGVMNFVRDRVKLDIALQWDMEITPGKEQQSKKNRFWDVLDAQVFLIVEFDDSLNGFSPPGRAGSTQRVG